MAKKIVLACAAGLSTSIMVEAMKKAAQQKGLDYEIWAEPVAMVARRVPEVDLVLLGPQVRFELGRLQKVGAEFGVPVQVIEMKDYGRMDGAKVVDSIKDIIK